MTIRKTMTCSLVVGFGLLAFAAPPARAQQYEQRYAHSRDMVALQDDLRGLDASMSALSRRNPRYAEFERRTDEIRRDVTALADEIRQHQEERREGYGGDQAQVAALRHSIAILRDDVEDAQSQGRGRRAFVVPAGTDIQVMLDQPLSSRTSNLEDRIDASTIAAIRVEGRTVIPAGATVSGTVREVRSRHRGQQDGWLRLDFDSVTPQGGPRMPIRSHVVAISEQHSGDSNALRNGGLGALLGGVIGGIIDGQKGALIGAAVGAGGGLLASHGDDVELPEGALVTLRLDGPVTLDRTVAYRR